MDMTEEKQNPAGLSDIAREEFVAGLMEAREQLQKAQAATCDEIREAARNGEDLAQFRR